MLEWLASLSGEVRVAIGMPFVLFVFYIGFKTADNMIGMYKNMHDKNKWSLFSLFSSSQLNDQGNYHRKETHKYGISLLLLMGILALLIHIFTE
ncbi:hypothetical protein [Aliikangiella coralliicola]|uniref:DUF3899 domain-containing protein n=1 Tax=Aliikangiella coralliicola TaxID=2592383 RepID=A0A545UFN4_9GAMM|nr:hypothetical protein [Aliikangiella coralliicola]TQV88281.1 hypothetical protein FLL46_07065 [Aliikangiella coralliicola]